MTNSITLYTTLNIAMAVAVPAPSTAVPASVSAKAKSKAGAVPPRRLTKEALATTHNAHLKKQSTSPLAPRPVKQPVLADAYPASTKSIRELEIVLIHSSLASTHLFERNPANNLTDPINRAQGRDAPPGPRHHRQGSQRAIRGRGRSEHRGR